MEPPMTTRIDPAISFCRSRAAATLDNLKQLVAIPSVSTDPGQGAEVRRAATWLCGRLSAIGMERAEVMETGGHPVVYAEWLRAPGAPTVLVYGHYDVQPVDPIELWQSPPFEAVERDGRLFGRGVSDMKGQIVAGMAAVEALVACGGLPVNIKWLLEGEEENGSASLPAFLERNRERFSADWCLNVDGTMLGPDQPTINYGLRGLVCFELRLQGASVDLHSGQYGGTVPNPAMILARVLAGLHDERGKVTLRDFYRDVTPLDTEERAELARLPTGERHYLDKSGAPGLCGEEGYTPNERTGARPTLEVNGLYSGFTGQGFKTVLPARAGAKISMRLVPDQQPAHVASALREYLERTVPQCVRWELDDLGGYPAVVVSRSSAVVRAYAEALEQTWGVRPLYSREGGSIPVVGLLRDTLGVHSVIGGFGLPDDRIHSPNEKLDLATWRKGTQALVRFFCGFSA